MDYQKRVDEACRLVAKHFFGSRGDFAYQAFDYVNTAYFNNELPTPLFEWALTAHGRCMAYTLNSSSSASARHPYIVLHPSLLGGSESLNPWRISERILGPCWAFDAILHELIHVSVEYRLGGWRRPDTPKFWTSHNNPLWVDEVNRIAGQMGFKIKAGMSKTKRVAVEGKRTKTGKPLTKVVRHTEGDVPFECVVLFPQELRLYLKQHEYYMANKLPFKFDGAL